VSHDPPYGPETTLDRSVREQQLRLRRLYMSYASYAMWFGLALIAWSFGLLTVQPWQMVLAGAGILVTQALLYTLIRSGLNLSFRDPSLTMQQLLVAQFWILLLIWYGQPIRGQLMLVYLIAMLFGIFQMDRREFALLGAISYSGFLAMLTLEQLYRETAPPMGESVMAAIVLGGVLGWAVLFGSYVSNVRDRLRTRNTELQDALALNRQLAERDNLTGLYNRRVVMLILEQTKIRSDRTHEPFSVILVDIDHFKTVNDLHGHLAGDDVLRGFAAAAEETLRAMDTIGLRSEDPSVGRVGGEEFLLTLPDTALGGACCCAERLRKSFAQTPDLPTPVSLSAGVAEYQRGESVTDLVGRADAALYAAKDKGRDQVISA
jgi:diguanylate cyclase